MFKSAILLSNLLFLTGNLIMKSTKNYTLMGGFVLLRMLYPAVVYADDTEIFMHSASQYQFNIGMLHARSLDLSSNRVRLRAEAQGYVYGDSDLDKVNTYFRFMRSNASFELNTETTEVEAYNVDMDVISFWHPAKNSDALYGQIALGRLEISRDVFMNMDSDVSFHLVRFQGQFGDPVSKNKKSRLISGGGGRTLGYRYRAYTDGSDMHALELLTLELRVGGAWDTRMPMTLTASAQGDLGITNGFVFDAQLETRYNILLWSGQQDLYLELLWKYNLHKNTARSKPADARMKAGVQLVGFFQPL